MCPYLKVYQVPNPFKRPTIQDDIIASPDLTPQAKIVGSPYAPSTVRNVAEVPKTNQLEQLAAGLADINPAIQQFVGIQGKKYTASELAAADSASMKTNSELAEATREGFVAPGASRLFEDRFQTNLVKRHADGYAPALAEAWAQSGVSQLDAPQGAFEKFVGEFTTRYNTDHLEQPGNDGTSVPKYSPKQLADAKYKEIQDAAIANLNAHNTNVVIDARTQHGFDVFAGNVQNFVKDSLVGTDGQPLDTHDRNYAPAAAKIADLMHNSTTGMYSGGMTNQKMTEMTALGVMQTAIDARDSSVIDRMGAAIDASRDKSSPITGTQVWIKHATATKEHVASITMTDIVHAEEVMKIKAQGTPDERLKLAQDQAANLKGAVKETAQNQEAHALKDVVYNFPDPFHMTPDELLQQKAHLAELRKKDPTEALSAETTLHALRHPQELLGTAHTQSMNEMTLARMVDANPSSPQTARAMDLALQHGDIDGAAWNRLHNDTEARRNGPLQKMLAQPSVSHMLGSIEKGGVANIEKMTGSESLAGGLARMDAERVVQSYLKVHPQATDLDVVDELAKRSQGIVDGRNSVRVEEISQQKEQKRITDQILAAENQTRDIAQMDAEKASIRKEYSAKYTDKAQLEQVTETVYQHRKNKKR
jgi:hypothetical protein